MTFSIQKGKSAQVFVAFLSHMICAEYAWIIGVYYNKKITRVSGIWMD